MKPRIVIGLYALLALTIINVFPHFLSPNELTRWALVAAIVEEQTVEVTHFVPPNGAGVEDLAQHDGRLYSNKAPGGALLGIPGYLVARAIVGPASPASIRPTLYAMRLTAATLPALLLAFAFVFAARKLGGRIEVPLLALLFGTPLFAYGMLNFSHALAAAALFGAWVLLFVKPNEFAAGALIGLAVFSEYPCAVAAAVLIACAPWRCWWKIVAGGFPFAVALAAYDKIAFGSWLALSSGNEIDPRFRAMAAHGVFGIDLPNPVTLLRLLFDPARGLFVFSPVLIVALLAIPRARRAMTARAFWSLMLVPATLVLLYSGYPNWHGGWTVGARYLVVAMPFLALLLAFGAASKLESFLLGASIAACVVTAIVFPFVPPEVPVPWGTFATPLLTKGLIAPNLFHLAARPLAVAVPFALVLAAVARKDALLFAGIVAMIAIAMLVPLAPRPRIERAFIEQTYFERNGAIAKEAGREIVVSPGLFSRSDAERRRPPASWPF